MTLLDERPRSILNDPDIICHTQPQSINLLSTKMTNVRLRTTDVQDLVAIDLSEDQVDEPPKLNMI